jgi:glutamate N-acetyltransferase/amino-acid N-acetyltransferase
VGCREDEVLVMSTGVIGTHLPMDKIKHGVSQAVDVLSDSPDAWQQAAEAILTTDTRPKLAAVKTASGYAVAGIAKGSGMIAPHMATMLGIMVTDAPLSAAQARESLQAANHESFNRIVVDGDMSTNDTVLLLSSAIHTADQPDLRDFNPALAAVCTHLAKAIVRDGEGATKFITIQVVAAASDDAAKTIANAIATSPLVKTAFYGGDANWGRIIAAAGRAGVSVDPSKLRLWFASGEEAQPDLLLFQNGMPTDYSEAAASEIMSQSSITVMLDCGQGDGQAVIWTCDLSHDYVSINGHYRS